MSSSASSALNVLCVLLVNRVLLSVLISLNSRVWSCSVLAMTSLLSCCMCMILSSMVCVILL